MDIRTHYDMLIEENNDPFRDPPTLRKYMESWDGQVFLDLMELDPSKTVLEIGIGTGRLAEKTAGCCCWLTGIDISAKTIERARENLQHCLNISLICDDFITHQFTETYDVVYSSLTMMHFQDKRSVIGKIHALLKCKGLHCKRRINHIECLCKLMGDKIITNQGYIQTMLNILPCSFDGFGGYIDPCQPTAAPGCFYGKPSCPDADLKNRFRLVQFHQVQEHCPIP